MDGRLRLAPAGTVGFRRGALAAGASVVTSLTLLSEAVAAQGLIVLNLGAVIQNFNLPTDICPGFWGMKLASDLLLMRVL